MKPHMIGTIRHGCPQCREFTWEERKSIGPDGDYATIALWEAATCIPTVSELCPFCKLEDWASKRFWWIDQRSVRRFLTRWLRLLARRRHDGICEDFVGSPKVAGYDVGAEEFKP